MIKFTFKAYLFLIVILLISNVLKAQTNIFSEDFSSITSGNNASNAGANTSWVGNSNFPTVVSAYQAGGAVKLGSTSAIGSITSLPLDLSVNSGSFKIKFKVKGWTTVEGTIIVSVAGLPSQTVTYSSVMAGSFEQNDLSFTGGTTNSTIKFETSAKRAYIDDVIVYYESGSTATITTPSPTSLSDFTALVDNASTSQTFITGGTNLNADLVITAPENFELRENGIGIFASSVVFPPLSGTVTPKTIEVRIASTASASSVLGNVICSSTGASSKTISVSGNVISAIPTIIVTEVYSPNMSVELGSIAEETIIITGANLTGNIQVTIDGANANMFSVATLLNPMSVLSGIATITYNPTKQGTHTATLHVQSTNTTPISLSLYGSAVFGTLVANDAKAISSTSFSANWYKLPGAVSYELSVDKSSGGAAVLTDLIISEYIEGTSFNKALEIYNGTGTAVDLSSYSIKKQTNGAGAYDNEFVLTGTLLNNDFYILANPQANSTILAFADVANNSAISFNGNDAVGLFKNGVLIDEVGIFNQTTDWGKDMTLIRKATINAPKAQFNPVDWDIQASDYFNNLNIHNALAQTLISVAGSPFTIYSGELNSFLLSGLTPNSDYKYKLRASDGNVFSLYSNTISVTTSPLASLDIIEKNKVYAFGGNIIIQSENNSKLLIFNSVGQMLLSKDMQKGSNTIKLNAKGVFFVKLGNDITKVML